MTELCKRFWADERGISAIQYALVAIICSVSIIAGLTGSRDGINNQLNQAGSAMRDATN